MSVLVDVVFVCVMCVGMLVVEIEGGVESDVGLGFAFLDSIVVSIPACHAGDPGSIPGRGASLLFAPFFINQHLPKSPSHTPIQAPSTLLPTPYTLYTSSDHQHYLSTFIPLFNPNTPVCLLLRRESSKSPFSVSA